MASPEIARNDLRSYLEAEQDRLKEDSKGSPHDHWVLNQSISALEALDYGDVWSVFDPIGGKHGPDPTKAHKLRRAASVHVAVLHEMKHSFEEAEGRVGDAYDVDSETVRSWRKQAAEAAKSNPEDPYTAETEAILVYRSSKKLGLPHSLAARLAMIARDGKSYQQVMPKKKPVPGGKKLGNKSLKKSGSK